MTVSGCNAGPFVPTRPPPGVVVSAAQTERHQGEVPLLINTDTVVPSS